MRMSLILTGAACAVATSVVAQTPADRTVIVKFAPGASAKTLAGVASGYRTTDYRLAARAGQTLTAKLAGHPSVILSVLDASGEAVEGAIMTDTASVTLPANGAYRVRVGLMRNDARRGVARKYSLTVTIR